MTQSSLEERTEQESFVLEPDEATVRCSYCRKEIPSHKAFYSSNCGFPYCSEQCFIMFTED